MDYDFDAWSKLGEMREAALRQAREAEAQETQRVQPEIENTRSETVAAVQNEPVQNASDVVKTENAVSIPAAESARTENVDSLEPGAASPETQPPHASETVAEAAQTQEAEALPPEIAPVPEVAENAQAVPEKTRPEMPMRYRNAEWSRPINDGETNLWKRDDVPHEGWSCVDIIDLGAPMGVCRMCNTQIIRYVHVMRHPEYPRTIGAGCVCAGRMEGDPARARERENAFKNRLARRETFLGLPRKKSRNGNEDVKYHGEIVTLYPDKFKRGQWKAIFRGQYTTSCATKEDALSEAFDAMDPPVPLG